MTVRELVVRDPTDSIRLTLWNDSTKCPIQTGQPVIIKDAVLSYSDFYSSPVVRINDIETIEVWSTPPFLFYLYLLLFCLSGSLNSDSEACFTTYNELVLLMSMENLLCENLER